VTGAAADLRTRLVGDGQRDPGQRALPGTDPACQAGGPLVLGGFRRQPRRVLNAHTGSFPTSARGSPGPDRSMSYCALADAPTVTVCCTAGCSTATSVTGSGGSSASSYRPSSSATVVASASPLRRCAVRATVGVAGPAIPVTMPRTLRATAVAAGTVSSGDDSVVVAPAVSRFLPRRNEAMTNATTAAPAPIPITTRKLFAEGTSTGPTRTVSSARIIVAIALAEEVPSERNSVLKLFAAAVSDLGTACMINMGMRSEEHTSELQSRFDI